MMRASVAMMVVLVICQCQQLEQVFPQMIPGVSMSRVHASVSSSMPEVCHYSGWVMYWWCSVGRDDFPVTSLAIPLHNISIVSPCFPLDEERLFIHCKGHNILRVPKELLPKHLSYLKISDTNITELKAGELADLDVSHISINENPIQSVDLTTFDDNYSVRYLNLSNNQLYMKNSIHHSFFGTFKALKVLQQLDLSFNDISLTSVDQYVKDVDPISLSSDPFLPKLTYVNFRGNPLVRLERNLFYGLRNSSLREINFQDCELESLDPYTFQPLHQLEHLDFYSNPALLVLSPYHSPLSTALYYLQYGQTEVGSSQFTSLGLGNNNLLQVKVMI